jgi:Tfp pilus assembly protein PilF
MNRALEIYVGLGHRQGQAEVLNNMGEALLPAGATAEAQRRHREALHIAAGSTMPAEEARAHEGLGRCQLQSGQTAAARASLHQALTIYQRINSANAERVAALLRKPD